jgi:predicted phage replisome organizer
VKKKEINMSESKKYFYLKLKDSFFASEEMLLLESMPDGLVYQNIYLRMCLLSLKNEGALTFKKMIPYDLNMLSTVLRIDKAQMKMAVDIFEKLGLVTKADNEVLFMADIQTLIGQSSTEAERVAKYRKRIENNCDETPLPDKEEIFESTNDTENIYTKQDVQKYKEPVQKCTKNVQMYESCTPELEIELEIKKERERELENSVRASDLSKHENKNESPESFQEVVKICFDKLQEHNKTHEVKKRVPISRDLLSFTQKEGRELAEYMRNEQPNVILQALANYLRVADMETWKTSFSFQAFCKNYIQYTNDYFAIEKFDKSNDIDEICRQFRAKMELDNRFDVAEFLQHKKDWLELGRPDGEAYFVQQEKWYATDND